MTKIYDLIILEQVNNREAGCLKTLSTPKSFSIFEFNSDLTVRQTKAHIHATGMMISDVHNPAKDLPGQGMKSGVFTRLIKNETKPGFG